MRCLLLGVVLNAVLFAQGPQQPAAPKDSVPATDATVTAQAQPVQSDETQKKTASFRQFVTAILGQRVRVSVPDAAALDQILLKAGRLCSIPLITIVPREIDKKMVIAVPHSSAVSAGELQPPAPSCDDIKR